MEEEVLLVLVSGVADRAKAIFTNQQEVNVLTGVYRLP